MTAALKLAHVPKERPLLMKGPLVLQTLAGLKTQTRRVINPQPVLRRTTDGTPFWHMKLRDGFVNYGEAGLPAIFTHGSVDQLGTYRPGVCPYGVPGDRLWVRETFAVETNAEIGEVPNYHPPFKDGRPVHYPEPGIWEQAHYRATDPEPDLSYEDHDEPGCRWKPSIFMPRWACRLVLEITEVRVQRLQDISEEDAKAEGVELPPPHLCPCETGADDPGPHLPMCPWRSKSIEPTGLPHKDAFAHLWDSINEDRGFGWDANPWVWALTFKRVTP